MLARLRGALIYAAVCAVVLVAFRGRAWQHVAALNGEEWHPIQTFVRDHRAADEPIAFVPGWTAGHATDQYKFRGIDRLAEPSAAWADRERPRSFWVVSQFGAFDADDVPADLYPHRAHRRLGGADVWVMRREPFELPDSLLFRLHEARCELRERGGKRLELVWRRTGHVLPASVEGRRRLAYLGCRPEEGRFAGRSRIGIWLHPPEGGSAIVVEWPEIEITAPWLAVDAGIRDRVATRDGAPVRVEVSLDGRALRSASFPSERGWKTLAVELGPGRVGTKGRLSFAVTAAKNHSRHFLLDASFASARPAETGAAAPVLPRDRRERRNEGEGDLEPRDEGGEPGEDEPEAERAARPGAAGEEG